MLSDLKGRFREFEPLIIDNRVKGHHELPQPDLGWTNDFYKLFSYAILPGIAALAYAGLEFYGEINITPYILSLLYSGADVAAKAIMASPILYPLTMAAGAGLVGGAFCYFSYKLAKNLMQTHEGVNPRAKSAL